MPQRSERRRLDRILRAVSRSIYLTLRAAPRKTRPALAAGYLFCRAADTIADTSVLPTETRLACLARFRAQFEGETWDPAALEEIAAAVGAPQKIPEERELLLELPACFRYFDGLVEGDRERLRRLVTTLTQGMETDLRFFPDESSGEVRALEDEDALDLYTYHVAGCVGEFWTDLQLAHVPSLRRWRRDEMVEEGIRFGKGLQLTNILRDLDKDLLLGRCYLPSPRLERVGLTARDLRDSEDRSALLPLLRHYLERTLELYRSGLGYTLALPRREVRLRLACIWPLLIGLGTLERLALSEEPFAPGRVHKISRTEVRRILRRSLVRAATNRGLGTLYEEGERAVREAVERLPRLG